MSLAAAFQALKSAERYDASLWDCEHTTSRLTEKSTSNGGRMFARQCLSCGGLVGNYLKHAEVPSSGERIWPFDSSIREAWTQTRQRIGKERVERAKHEWWRLYNEYLETPQWGARRAKVFVRAGGKCEGCGERPPTQAHHLTYGHVGQELLLFELVALCDRCHEKAHS